MEKDELIRIRQANFRQTNAYAMQNGIFLGIWAIACQACFVAGIANPLYNTLWMVTFLGIPVVTWLLTLRFRRIVGLDVNFSFSRGFMHAFLTLLYCAVWAGVATFIYLQFFDNGYMFDSLVKTCADPEVAKRLEEAGMLKELETASGTSMTINDVINSMRNIGAGNYAAFIVYTYMLTSPIIAVVVGLCSMHRVHYKRN